MEDTRTVHPVHATSGGRDHSTKIGEPLQAFSPLSLSSCRGERITSTPEDDEQQPPDSPTSPPSYTPNGYSPVMIRTSYLDDYGLVPPPENQEEAHYNNNNNPIASYTGWATDASFQSNQDVEPLNYDDDLEYGDMYPPCYIADPCVVVRQNISFAETSLRCHNDDPNNEIKYELIEAIESSYMLDGSGDYAHVNFTARAKEGGSQPEFFFAELNLRGQGTILTCFRSLKEEDDHVGGRSELEREDDSIDDDLDHCYACGDLLRHPRDGASYQAGHGARRGCYDFP